MALTAAGDVTGSIPAGTEIGQVHLTVRDLKRSRAFYEDLIGLRASDGLEGALTFGPASGPALLSVYGDASAPARDPRQTGLFHLAILLPTRRDLAVALVRLAQGGWRLSGASDHLVSEALYLQDPDGNGIELYRDRDRSDWSYDERGQTVMSTLPLDLDDVLGELRSSPPDPESDAMMPAGTRIGHVHLQVADIPSVERFYEQVLGFDVTVRSFPGALFVSAGGYHHHIGLNVWNSRGGSSPPPGGVGLRAYELKLGDAAARDGVLANVASAGIPVESFVNGEPLVRDPSGNGIVLTV